MQGILLFQFLKRSNQGFCLSTMKSLIHAYTLLLMVLLLAHSSSLRASDDIQLQLTAEEQAWLAEQGV